DALHVTTALCRHCARKNRRRPAENSPSRCRQHHRRVWLMTTTYDGRPYPTISAYLYYEDLAAALDWLADAFGLRERMRDAQPDGSLGHCEMEYGDSVVMFGSPPGFRSPAKTGVVPFGMYVHVD